MTLSKEIYKIVLEVGVCEVCGVECTEKIGFDEGGSTMWKIFMCDQHFNSIPDLRIFNSKKEDEDEQSV